MSLLFGKTKETEIEEYERLLLDKEKKNGRKDKQDILKKIKTLFANIDIDFFHHMITKGEKSGTLFEINMENITYNRFISYKLFKEMNEIPSIIELPIFKDFSIKERYMDFLNSLNSIIFMKNVNIEWKLLQLAKSDTSIQIPSPHKQSSSSKQSSPYKQSSPPKPPPLPKQRHSSKNNASKSRGSPLTSKKLEDTKNILRVVKPKSPQKKELSPNDPSYDIEIAFLNLEKKSPKK